ncbi:WG repeat-containing protein, partial [Arthrospira platensis SPKY1]|nr:WG repeat-containing protein [Arthrospira platensis SPKY1]
IIPFVYESIDVDLQGINFENDTDKAYYVVAQKGKYFGVLNLKNEVIIPFEYTELKRISETGIFKAKTKSHYTLINHKNELLNPGPFDEVANFEFIDYKSGQDKMHYEALTFY